MVCPLSRALITAPANAISAGARHDRYFFRAQAGSQFVLNRTRRELTSPGLALHPDLVQEAMFASVAVKDELGAICRLERLDRMRSHHIDGFIVIASQDDFTGVADG